MKRTQLQVGLFIGIVSAGAAALAGVTAAASWHQVIARPGAYLLLLGLTLALQILGFEIRGKGPISLADVGLIALAILAGPAAAIAAGLAAATARFVISRGRIHRALFDAANLGLAAAPP